MTKILLSWVMKASTLLVILLATPAHACMSSGPEGYVSGLVWRTKATEIPVNAMVLKIKFVKPTQEWGGFLARVIEGPERMMNRVYRFVSETSHSCVGFGKKEGFIVVRRKPIVVEGDDSGGNKMYLSALDYEPSYLDWLYRIFSDENWHYPGSPSELEF